MDYQQTVEYLFNSTPAFENVGAPAYKEGLSNTLALDEHYGHPHNNFKAIHVAGTNGKGSTSHMLASILQEEGYKVGLYTSPHLIDFRERIRINGQCINKEYVVNFVEEGRNFFESLHPSFFELTTSLAFKYFSDQKIDIAVIEVGLGGRLDCTNIISPILSIITNISFDHTQFLGNTLAKIAAEKAGIIKQNIPIVIGESLPETEAVFINKATNVNAPIYFAQQDHEVISSKMFASGIERIYQTKAFGELICDLLGDYQEKNINTVLCAIKRLQEQNIIHGNTKIAQGLSHVMSSTGLLGRWQRLQTNPLVICDTGHNVGGWQYLSKQLKTQNCKQMRIVFGMVNDKDICTIMTLLPNNAIYYWTQPISKRAFLVDQVAEIGFKNHLRGEMFNNVHEAYQKALQDADSDDFIFVGGSSYIVADLLSNV